MDILSASRQKMIFVSAMNNNICKKLFDNKITEKLEEKENIFIGLIFGWLKECFKAMGRMTELEEVIELIENIFFPKKDKILISYGATR